VRQSRSLDVATVKCGVVTANNDDLLRQTAALTEKKNTLECGPMPNLMVALSNIGGALCSTPQSVPDAHY